MKTKHIAFRTLLAIIFAAGCIAFTAVRAQSQEPPQGSPDPAFVSPGEMPPDAMRPELGPHPPMQNEQRPAGPGESWNGPGQPMPPQSQGPQISDKEIEDFMAQLKSDAPDQYEELTGLRQRDPRMFHNRIGEMIMQSRNEERLKKEDPETWKTVSRLRTLGSKERTLAKKYRDAESKTEKETIGRELKSVLDETFSLNLKMRQKEIAELEKRILRVKDDIQQRSRNKDEIIQRHFDEITGKSETLQW